MVLSVEFTIVATQRYAMPHLEPLTATFVWLLQYYSYISIYSPFYLLYIPRGGERRRRLNGTAASVLINFVILHKINFITIHKFYKIITYRIEAC